MESVFFWTTLSAFLGCKTNYLLSMPKHGVTMITRNGEKISKMKESKERFTIKLDNRIYAVIAIIQPDESVVFIIEMDERIIKIFKGDSDNWCGNAEQHLVDSIGKAIEEA